MNDRYCISVEIMDSQDKNDKEFGGSCGDKEVMIYVLEQAIKYIENMSN
jgi:uncharacterized protein YlxP (DUF503 family)